MSNTFRRLSFIVILSGAGFCASAQNLVKYVDPFIGTGGHGHTYPGATVPFGMVQLSPDNGDEGWDWCSGYNESSKTIAGFSHMHLSGTGCGDWTDISIMPHTEQVDDTFHFFKVPFSHKNEHASPGYYSVLMDNGIRVSLTATDRCGFHKYEFPKGKRQIVRFHLTYGINWDSATKTRIWMENDSTIVGYRYSHGWASVQKVYFAARLSRPVSKFYLYDNETHQLTTQENEHHNIYNAEVELDPKGDAPLLMKVALSSVSTDKAQESLKEIKGWNFDACKNAASQKWEKELDKIQVQTKDERMKRIFYTALYHTCMAPVLYSDEDGAYKNAKDHVCNMNKGQQRYTVFSLWDTFRGLNPLFTLTQPEKNKDILNSMLAFYDENGLLPVWDLSTFETNCMSGYHAVPVLADAVLKNTAGLDAEKVLTAMKASAHQKQRGTPDYIKYGYLPADKGSFSVTLTVEYAYDDWCIAQVAKKLGHMDDYDEYMKRSASWKELFDKGTGFMRGKNADGSWVSPFDPYMASTNGKSNYEEGNAWQYTFFVPHDVRGLADGFGSNEAFVKKLDSLFTVSSHVNGEEAPPDVSGLIGQYAHGNEPSHHIAYMYNFVGQPWKTQAMVRFITDSMYHDQPDGYAGNEDCGQMSAWAVWSMMGMFPANPANGEYVFGSPVFDAATIQLPGGKKMLIKTINNGKANKYIQSVSLYGKPYNKSYIDHATLVKGGQLVFVMGNKPNEHWGAAPECWPTSASYSKK